MYADFQVDGSSPEENNCVVDGVLAVGLVEAGSEDGVLASYQDLSPYALSCILAEVDLNYIKVLACCYHYTSAVLVPVFPNSAWVVIWQKFTWFDVTGYLCFRYEDDVGFRVLCLVFQLGSPVPSTVTIEDAKSQVVALLGGGPWGHSQMTCGCHRSSTGYCVSVELKGMMLRQSSDWKLSLLLGYSPVCQTYY